MHQAQRQQKIYLKVVYTVVHCTRSFEKNGQSYTARCKNQESDCSCFSNANFSWKTSDAEALFMSTLTSIQPAPSCSLLSLHISASLCGVFASIQLTIGFDWPDPDCVFNLEMNLDSVCFQNIVSFNIKPCQMQSATSLTSRLFSSSQSPRYMRFRRRHESV